MNKPLVVHPLLFAFFPVLALYFFNIDQIPPTQIILPAMITMFGTLALWLLVGFILKELHLAALLVSPFIILFLSYGYIYNYIGSVMWRSSWYLALLVLGTVSLAIILAYWWFCSALLKSKHGNIVRQLNKVFNTIALLLIVFNIIQIGVTKANSSTNKQHSQLDCTSVKSTSNDLKPDIYYIILDEYPGLDQLKEAFNYDNSEFVQKLNDKGFYVATKSKVKVARTDHSLPSSLNMENLEEPVHNLLPLTRNSKVAQFLKCQGYKYITFGNFYHTTAYNPYADLNFNLFGFRFKNELSSLVVRSSVISLLLSLRYFHRKAILSALEEIPRIAVIESPKFIFAHIMCPHEPYVFGPNGEAISFGDSIFGRKPLYLDQLIFITKRVDRLIDDILSQSKNPPIIVIQGDHGKRRLVDEHGKRRLVEGSANSILNAYYLPSDGEKLLYENISPVNTFRVIFNHYFHTKYELLPD